MRYHHIDEALSVAAKLLVDELAQGESGPCFPRKLIWAEADEPREVDARQEHGGASAHSSLAVQRRSSSAPISLRSYALKTRVTFSW